MLINKLFPKSYNNNFITESTTALNLSREFTLMFIGKFGKNEYLYTLLDTLIWWNTVKFRK